MQKYKFLSNGIKLLWKQITRVPNGFQKAMENAKRLENTRILTPPERGEKTGQRVKKTRASLGKGSSRGEKKVKVPLASLGKKFRFQVYCRFSLPFISSFSSAAFFPSPILSPILELVKETRNENTNASPKPHRISVQEKSLYSPPLEKR